MSLLAHLPALQVAVPLIAAPIVAMVGRRRFAYGVLTLVSLAIFASAILLTRQVLDTGPISYAMGSWPAPIGIEYRIDLLTCLALLLVSGIAAICAPYAPTSIDAEIEPKRIPAFVAMYLLAISGLSGMVATGDAFNIYVFIEITSLSTYALVAMGRDRRALSAAFQYLVIGTIGATFILIGIGLIYMMTGTLNIADLAARLPAVEGNRVVVAAFAFLVIGLAIKIALFPLHVWLPNAYAFAPSLVSAFQAATATKVGIYVLLRFVVSVFGASYAFDAMPLGWTLIPFAVVAMFAGSLVAIFQVDLKRLFAYSSVAQIGYIMLGLALGTQAGLSAALIHLINHGLIKAALFLALGLIAVRLGGTRLDHIQGLGRTMPVTAAAMVIGGLSLIGVPLTSGFISKWYLVTATIEAGMWPLAVLVMASSLLAVIYVWRLVEMMYFRDPVEGAAEACTGRSNPWLAWPAWTAAALCIYFGIDTRATAGLAELAARALTGGA